MTGPSRHKPRTWTFEHLEERHFLSATPLTQPTVVSYSSDTAEGMQQIVLNELLRAARQYAANTTTEEVTADLQALPNDPYVQYQWHLINMGQAVNSPNWQEILGTPGEDINVLPVWNLGYTGEGVLVAVVDSGIQLDHPDLAGNISSEFGFDAISGDSNATAENSPHGTAVAGLIGAVGNNGTGTTGVAYGATLVPIRLVDDVPIDDERIANALGYEVHDVDIYNNSWGPGKDVAGEERFVRGPGLLTVEALRQGVTEGRGGLGSIYVFSTGNDAGPLFSEGFADLGWWDSANYNGYINSRYTIGVGGIDQDGSYNNADGTVTSYLEAGTAILVAAPTGSLPINVSQDTGAGSGIWTTDWLGADGYNGPANTSGFEVDGDYFADTDYMSRFSGSSAAAPLVSGVVALMLEANPNLSWRDVQEILVRSARQADFEAPTTGGGYTSTQSWVTNPFEFFRTPDPIPTLPVSPWDPAVDGFNAVYNPDSVVNFGANPNNPAFFYGTGSLITPQTFYIQPQAAAPPVPQQPGTLQFMSVYAPPYQQQYVNGAGYTVSSGRGSYGDEYGYGHGVVDAELAVQLASQWTTQGQSLPDELTFTTYVQQPGGLTIQAAEKLNEDAGELLVPGAVADDNAESFASFWEEYFEEPDPAQPVSGPFANYDVDSATPDDRGGFFYFEVPDTTTGILNGAMTVEWVEVTLDIEAGGDALNQLRVTLVSPDGTCSELINNFPSLDFPYSLQVPSASNFFVEDLLPINDGDQFSWTFSTNRNWGERYDNQLVIDPRVTITNASGTTVMNPNYGKPFLDDQGYAVERGWMLVFENYSDQDFPMEGMAITWHGSPIDPNTERVQGVIGVDAGFGGVGANDGLYTYSNLTQTREPKAANVTVVATKVSDGTQTKFVTGADGNFYFDLAPDEYIISIQDPLGRTALDEANVPAGMLPIYQQEWHINEDWFYQPNGSLDLTSFNFRAADNGLGEPVHVVDTSGVDIVAGPKYINFLLNPGPLPANETIVSGSVFADIDGDGAFNNDDAPAVDFIVYADTNRSGLFETTDLYVITNQLGEFSLTIPVTGMERFEIGAVAPNTDWEQTFPTSLTVPVLASPGTIVTNVEFGFEPTVPVTPPPQPEDGSILGVVFNDNNGNLTRDAGEEGIAGIHVYVDLNNDLSFTTGEPEAITSANGSYFLAEVDPAVVSVRLETPAAWEITVPTAGYRSVDVSDGGTKSNVLFGIRNMATGDWGDLPDSFLTTAAANGATHSIVAGFYLGTKVDGEVNGQPTADALGDDAVSGDEDGVSVLATATNPTSLLKPGTADSQTTVLRVTVAGIGGLLTGWIDFDGNGTFESDEKVTWRDPDGDLVEEVDLNPGTYNLPISVPTALAAGEVAARFRWGEAGLDFFGPAVVGEVEDYFFTTSATQSSVILDGDYDSNGVVEEADFQLWKSTFGSHTDFRADGNGDSKVDVLDYIVWRNHLGETAAASGSSSMVTSQTSSGDISTITITPLNRDSFSSADPAAVAAVEARLLSLGFRPELVRVGDSFQTYYRLASTVAQTPIGDQAVEGELASSASVDLALASLNPTGSATIRGRSGLLVQQTVDQGAAATSAELQLLDSVLTDIVARNDDQVDELLAIAQDEDQDSEASDVALAAVFNEETPWWLII